MGYYANGSGDIYVKPDAPLDHFREALKSNLFEFSVNKVALNGEEVVDFDIFADDKYHDDDVCEVLSLMEPYTVNGSLNYFGQDGDVWRFVFRNGHFEYEDADFYYESDIKMLKDKAVRDRITKEKIQKAEQILIDNGIDPDDACIVLQAVGYALLDEELYPENNTLNSSADM